MPVNKLHKNPLYKGRKNITSRNEYLKGLIALYEKIFINSGNPIVQAIMVSLKSTRNNRHPVRISEIVEENKKTPGKVFVIVAKVLNDETLHEIPKLNIVCMQISEAARAQIEKFGGNVYTLDKIFEVSPDLKDVVIIKGDVTKRKAYKYFGAPGDKWSQAYPKIRCKKSKNREKRIWKPNNIQLQ